MYSKDERFFNSKKHLQNKFFAKIKIDHRKFFFVIKNANKSVFSPQNLSKYDHQKIRLSKPFPKENTVLQNNEK